MGLSRLKSDIETQEGPQAVCSSPSLRPSGQDLLPSQKEREQFSIVIALF